MNRGQSEKKEKILKTVTRKIKSAKVVQQALHRFQEVSRIIQIYQKKRRRVYRKESMIDIAPRVLYKLTVFLILISLFFASSFVIYFIYSNKERRRYKYSKNATRYCRMMVQTINAKVVRKGSIPKTHSPFLYVSNHLGFLDVLVSNSQFPMFFVTSTEMRDTPFLGLLTDFGGCLYVDRSSRSSIQSELQEMVYFLKKGYQIVLYPEATSGNAEHILPFKRTLLTSASLAEVPIQPVVFNVQRVNGQPFTLKWRDHICWYGDISFVTSLLRLFSLHSLHLELHFLPQIKPSAWDDRRSVADNLHKQISEHFIPVQKKI